MWNVNNAISHWDELETDLSIEQCEYSIIIDALYIFIHWVEHIRILSQLKQIPSPARLVLINLAVISKSTIFQTVLSMSGFQKWLKST